MRKAEPDLPLRVGPGPDNPLGDYALHLGWPRILLHGTDRPDGIGRNVSHGCIHLYPREDIAQAVQAGLGRHSGARDRTSRPSPPGPATGSTCTVDRAPSRWNRSTPRCAGDARSRTRRPGVVQVVAGQYAAVVDWRAVDRAADERTNVPVVVAERSASVAGVQPAPPPSAPPQAQPAQGSALGQDFGREVEQAYARAIEQQRARGAAPPSTGAAADPGYGQVPPPPDGTAQSPSPAQMQNCSTWATQVFEREEEISSTTDARGAPRSTARLVFLGERP